MSRGSSRLFFFYVFVRGKLKVDENVFVEFTNLILAIF